MKTVVLRVDIMLVTSVDPESCLPDFQERVKKNRNRDTQIVNALNEQGWRTVAIVGVLDGYKEIWLTKE